MIRRRRAVLPPWDWPEVGRSQEQVYTGSGLVFTTAGFLVMPTLLASGPAGFAVPALSYARIETAIFSAGVQNQTTFGTLIAAVQLLWNNVPIPGYDFIPLPQSEVWGVAAPLDAVGTRLILHPKFIIHSQSAGLITINAQALATVGNVAISATLMGWTWSDASQLEADKDVAAL